jgi:hypothetical protein
VSTLFDPATGEVSDGEAVGKEFGQRYNGRYHMPLLPGESGTKAGGDYVPRGIMSATNLAGAIVDARELSVWEINQGMMGLAMRPELFERLTFDVNSALLAGADPRELRKSAAGVELIGKLEGTHELAKTAAGGNSAAIMGTNRHDVWEARAKTGVLLGTPGINREIEALEALLDKHGLERVPGLQERVVRNVGLNASGRLDDVLMSRRTGRLFLADMKTKRKPFYSWLEAWIQQAVYATSEWMLDGLNHDYVPGPLHHVDQETAILLRMPSDGSPPFLSRVDLAMGRRWAELARAVVDARSEARSVKTFGLAEWTEEVDSQSAVE